MPRPRTFSLVELAEAKLAGEPIAVESVRAAAGPLFSAERGGEIDVVVFTSAPGAAAWLAVAEEAGVAARRAGQMIFYSLASPEAKRMLESLYDLFCAEPLAKAAE